MHGDKKLYESGYTAGALKHWAKRIRRWHQGGQPRDACLFTRRSLGARKQRDAYVYFDNDAKVKAPADARSLLKLV